MLGKGSPTEQQFFDSTRPTTGMETVLFVVAVLFVVGVGYLTVRWLLGDGEALNREWGE